MKVRMKMRMRKLINVGTFIYDCEKDRRFDNIISDHSVSLWLYLDSNRPNYSNPLYKRFNKPITAPIGTIHFYPNFYSYYLI